MPKDYTLMYTHTHTLKSVRSHAGLYVWPNLNECETAITVIMFIIFNALTV